jgi:hypothetical protein
MLCLDSIGRTVSQTRSRRRSPRSIPERALHLVFSFVHPSKPSSTLGPFNVIWLNVDGMRSEAGGPLVAPYREHQWWVGQDSYFRLDCTAKVRVHFIRDEGQSKPQGEFERFSAVNGLAYGDDRVIAFLDQKKSEWLHYDSGYHWPCMAVTAI